MFSQARSGFTQDRDGLDAALSMLERLDDPEALLIGGLFRALEVTQHVGLATDHRMWLRLWKAIAAAPPTPMLVQRIRPMVAAILRILGRNELPGIDAVVPDARPDGDPQARLFAEWFAMMARSVEAYQRGDLQGMRACRSEVEVLARRAQPDQLLLPLPLAWGRGRMSLDIARCDRLDRAAAADAVHWLDRAVSLANGEEHPLWTMMVMGLAEALRLAGVDRSRSLALGLSTLSARARAVMLQNGVTAALTMAAAGAEDADQVIAWALEDGDLAIAVAALDASRGLALAASAASRGVADRLDAAGHPDLAEEWRSTAGRGRDELTGLPWGFSDPGSDRVPDTLRAKVLAALDSPGGGALVTTVEQIRSGLAATGAQALAYLLPATPRHRAQAVVVPVGAPVVAIELPGLAGDNPLRGYVNKARSRDLEAAPVDGVSLSEQLSAVGGVVGAAVLDELVRRLGTTSPAGPAHVILVPMGELALVPWHAAYSQTPTGLRYAVEDLVFSYSPSARLFCATAERPPAAARSALIVGNPDGTLSFAGQEARAIHRAFHPHGTYLGDGGTAPATAEAVLEWITSAGTGHSLLHFACHGRTDVAQPDRAELLLSRGALSAYDLLEATRLAELVVGQVFLAACHTSAIGRDYDEAFSLASVFLAAGAHTVFGSLWAVPDEATSLLMFMVHHYLTIDRLPPAHALHAAQRWMLDRNRRPPASMPVELAAFAVRPELADPVAWAAFTHLGR
jgi:hypothetical protein